MKKIMKVTKLTPKRILLEFETQKELTLHMFRFAEFFEGEEGIRGEKFTFDEFVDKYSDKEGNLDYFGYWEGYNIPKFEIDKFMELYEYEHCKTYEGISKREFEVLDSIKDLDMDGYVIACVKGDEICFKHENAHGIFFDNSEYRENSIKIVESMPKELKERFIDGLKSKHYRDDVLTDEIHAYTLAWNEDDAKDVFGGKIEEEEIVEYREELEKLYSKYNIDK